MIYADFSYYKDTYCGEMAEGDFKRLSRSASAYLDSITFDRIPSVTDEKIIETIGGGRVEYQAILDARNEEGIRSHHYELSNKEGAKLGMICGGRNDVLFIPLN